VFTTIPLPTVRPATLAALLLAAAAPIAQAEGADTYARAIDAARAPDPLSTRVAVAPHYIARGIEQGEGRPALQAVLDYGRKEGWRAGARTSTVDERFVDKGPVELGAYAGYSRSAGDFGYDAKASWYRYPGARAAGGAGPDIGELAAGLRWKSVYARYKLSLTPDFFGVPDARGSGYLDLGAHHAFSPDLLLNLHAGDGRVAGSSKGMWNWRELAAGLSSRLAGGWTLAFRFGRAIGGAGGTAIYDRYSTGNLRADGRPWAASLGRRSLVLSLNRRF
jgi:uncharacterized protein (TIGR02001 family)